MSKLLDAVQQELMRRQEEKRRKRALQKLRLRLIWVNPEPKPLNLAPEALQEDHSSENCEGR